MSEPRYHYQRGGRHAATFVATSWCDDSAVYHWCVQQFGPPTPGGSTLARWRILGAGMIFDFRDPDDAFAFRMRWC